MLKTNSSVILNKACDIIADNLGSKTAETYRNFFEGENAEEILASISTLMSGLVGDNNAKRQLADLVDHVKNT